MSELEQLRKEVKELRERIVQLEYDLHRAVAPMIPLTSLRDSTYIQPDFTPPFIIYS